jgi:nicotinate-nucleotide adenylyltransferase
MTRVGVFGGQFDPPHNGHVAVATAAIEQLGLDHLIVVVDADPPHRAASQVSADVRGRLAQAAFSGLPGVEVLVLNAGDSRYMVDTLRSLERQGELFLIVGADQLARLDQWHDPAGVRGLATIVVAPRDDIDSAALGARALEMAPVDLSSSGVRSALHGGADVEDRLPPAVFRLVTAEHIYK